MQAVLSAASHRATALAQKSTRDKAETRIETSTAYIPVPDAAGLVEHYVDLYPTDKWTEPDSYVKFSYTVDQCITTALTDGFTYLMDERDEDWLEKNNQDARGEGSSAQGASLASGTTTRSGALHRSAKSRGKEPEVLQPVLMSPDEFELVMGVFEKATHDKTPFLHLVSLSYSDCILIANGLDRLSIKAPLISPLSLITMTCTRTTSHLRCSLRSSARQISLPHQCSYEWLVHVTRTGATDV